MQKQKPEMKIESLPIGMIVPYWRNPRKNDKAVVAVKASIEQFGFRIPIIVDKKMVIISGHTRYRAAMQLGMTEIPSIVSDMTEAKAKKFRIVDNRTSELAEWDDEMLSNEVHEFADMDSFVDTFFKDTDLEKMLRDDIKIQETLDHSVTPAKMQKARDKPQTAMDKKRESVADGQIELICPHCTESYYVSVADIISTASSKKIKGGG